MGRGIAQFRGCRLCNSLELEGDWSRHAHWCPRRHEPASIADARGRRVDALAAELTAQRHARAAAVEAARKAALPRKPLPRYHWGGAPSADEARSEYLAKWRRAVAQCNAEDAWLLAETGDTMGAWVDPSPR